MEILIVGIIIVALMVWASTRIKRTAAAAFDAETIETSEFTIEKPDGWLSKVEPSDRFLFEAYTKDFGERPYENIRLGTANVERSDGNIEDALASVAADGEITDDLREVVNEVHYRVIECTLSEDGVDRLEWLKFAQADDSVYTFRIKALAGTTAEFRRDIEGMLDSFELN